MSISRKQLSLSAVVVAIVVTGGSFMFLHESADAKDTSSTSQQAAATVDVASVINKTILIGKNIQAD